MTNDEIRQELERTCLGKTISHVRSENDGGNVVLYFSDSTKLGLSADLDAGRPYIGVCELEPTRIVEPAWAGTEVQRTLVSQRVQEDASAKLSDPLAALKAIAAGMGNLSLEQMGPDGVSGPNDGKARALYLQTFVRLARETVAKAEQPEVARPLADWHEDDGDVLWWKFPVEESPYVGSPLDREWPGYHTHWTPLPKTAPVPPDGYAKGSQL